MWLVRGLDHLHVSGFGTVSRRGPLILEVSTINVGNIRHWTFNYPLVGECESARSKDIVSHLIRASASMRAEWRSLTASEVGYIDLRRTNVICIGFNPSTNAVGTPPLHSEMAYDPIRTDRQGTSG